MFSRPAYAIGRERAPDTGVQRCLGVAPAAEAEQVALTGQAVKPGAAIGWQPCAPPGPRSHAAAAETLGRGEFSREVAAA